MPAKYGARRRAALIAKFLDALEQGLSVRAAARSGGVSRKALREWRAGDPEFAAAWDAAVEAGWEALEDEAKRRAGEGVRKLVLHQGKPVMVPAGGYDANGQPVGASVPLYEHKYSDTLLMFLLSGRRAFGFKYRPEPASADVSTAPDELDDLEIARRVVFELTTRGKKLTTDSEG